MRSTRNNTQKDIKGGTGSSMDRLEKKRKELKRLTVALEREEAEILRKKERVAALREELMLEGGEEMRKEDVKEDEGIKNQHDFIAFR